MFLASSAGALGAAALSAGPAHAAADATCAGSVLQPCPPTPAFSYTTTDTDGTITIVWTAIPGDTVNPDTPTLTWAPSVTPPPEAPTPQMTTSDLGGTCAAQVGTKLTCTYTWPSALLDKSKIYVLNGTYTLTASASQCSLAVVCSSTPSPKPSASLTVDNPAAAPTGVNAVVQNSSQAKITWSPNSEPDITGYQVFRSGDPQAVCTVNVFITPPPYSCVDGPPKDGAYTYSVVAYRWPPNYSKAIGDQPKSPGTNAMPVTVTGTSANTTTTVTTAPPLGPSGFLGKSATPSKVRGNGAAGFFGAATPGTTAAAIPGGDTPAGADTGFLPNLPYGAQPSTTVPGDQAALAAPPAPHKGKTSVGTIAVIGAGLLIAVIALHGLWLRSEVRRSDTLEVLDPDV